MTKPSAGADRRLLEAAKKMIPRKGITGLRLREVARQAKVNLGMFHYHFQSKERFTRILLQEFYEEFFANLLVASRKGKDSRARLRNTLLAIGLFLKREHEMYLALAKDIMNQNPEVLDFVRENLPRHVAVIRELVENCQRERTLAALPFPQVIGFLMTSINAPTLVGYAVARGRSAPKGSKIASLLTDEAIAQRIDLAMKGLSP